MSEMGLDIAIQLFQLVETFDEYKDGLLDVLNKSTKVSDPNAARKRVMEIADAKKADLMKSSSEFKVIMGEIKTENKKKADYDRAILKAKRSEVEAKASMARSDAMARIGRAVPSMSIDAPVARTKFKTVDPEELERKSKEGLWCPICRQKDTSSNVVNNQPTCMKCMHKLVPRSELKNYNRAYRRQWRKRSS